MKSFLIILSAFIFFHPAFSQQDEKAEQVKKIEVVGTAEKEIVPNEIYLSIGLKEYKTKGGDIVPIARLENQLAKAVKNAGIDEDDFQIENVYGNNYWSWRRKKDDPEFLAAKQYRLKLGDLNKVNGILSELDPLGIHTVNISDYSHTNLEEYKKELKIKALQNAKEKAGYLLESIDQELGAAIAIYEIETGGPGHPQPFYRMEATAMDASGANTDIGFQKIKLRSEIRAVFEIK